MLFGHSHQNRGGANIKQKIQITRDHYIMDRLATLPLSESKKIMYQETLVAHTVQTPNTFLGDVGIFPLFRQIVYLKNYC